MESFSNVPIDFDSIPQAEEIKFNPIAKKYLWVSLFTTTILYLFFAAMTVGLFYAIESKKQGSFDNCKYVLAGLIIIYLITIIIMILGFKWKGFVIREKDIIYRTGLIIRKQVHIPFNRVQHCEVAQDAIERIVNLAKLKIYTAGGSRSDLSVPGLLEEDASKMKQFILQKSSSDSRKIIHDNESE